MRYVLYLIVVIIALIVFLLLYKAVKGDKYFSIGIALVLCIVVVSVFKVINVNTVDISSVEGSACVRVNSNDNVEILVQGEWVDTSEIALVSWLSDGVVLKFDDKEVKIIDSGIVSTIKVLEKLGILK